MKQKFIVALLSTLASTTAFSQVGIGTSTPSASTMLEIYGGNSGDNKGILIPRVGLKSTTDITTITGGGATGSDYPNSLLVYNNATNGDVVPGYYYWLTNRWVQMASKDDIQASQKTTTLSNGTNTTVVGTTTGTTIDYKISVPTASSTTLGVVKQAASNANVTINGSGELTALQPWNKVGTSTLATSNTADDIYHGKKVGIGFASGDTITSTLEVKGAATNKVSYNTTGMAIDFSQSNLAWTSASPGAFTMSNMKDGGTYTLAVKGTTPAAMSSFTQAGLIFKPVNNVVTTAGKQTLYTFIVMGTDVYFWMNTGF